MFSLGSALPRPLGSPEGQVSGGTLSGGEVFSTLNLTYGRRTAKSPMLSLTVFEFPTEAKATSTVLSTEGYSNPNAMVLFDGIGTVARRLSPQISASNRSVAPNHWQESLKFARGRFYVRMTYAHAPDPDPSAKTPWMDGDADAYFWKSARAIDARLKAYLAGPYRNKTLRD